MKGKANDKKRISRLELRLSPEDKKAIKVNASKLGMTMADYILHMAITDAMQCGHG